jgi:hypothetical protein
MTQLTINIGATANDKTGDTLRTAFNKANQNFTELYAAMGIDVQIPAQAGFSGYYLTTNGTSLSWAVPIAFPYQAGNAGKVLTTNGTGVFWNTPSGGGGGISLTAFSVTTNSASSNGSLVYNNITGIFTFTPPVIPTVPTYTVTTGSASGGGSLSLIGSAFTFNPASVPTVPTYTVTTNTASGNGSLSLSGSTFTFTPANVPTYSVSTTTASGGGTLSVSGSTFTFAPAVQYTLPIATTSILGGVKIDNNSIVINNGVISVGGALTSATIFKGDWNASTNTPTLSNSLPTGVQSGWQYIVSVQGTRDIGAGSTTYTVGDLVIYNGTSWSRIPGGNNVTAFNTRQGSITLTNVDVTTALGFTPYNSTNPSNYITLTGLSVTTNAASGSGSLSYTNSTGVFTFTPPNLSNYLTSITSSNVTTALGFTPYNSTNPNSYITLSAHSVTTNAGSSTSALSYSSTTGAFTFTPYALPTAVAGTNITGTKGGVIPDGTSITITNGVISSVSSAPALTITTASASGNGSLSYAAGTGTFTFTPANIPTYTITTAAANGSGALSLSGSTFTFTPASMQTPISATGILKSNGTSGNVSAATAGTDYIAPYTSQTQKYVFAAPNAIDGTPVFRALVASDIPTLNQNTSGTAAGLSATLGTDKGGTGVANNAASTLTISGAFATTFTISAATSLTLPTSGTVTALGNTVTGSGSIVLATSPTLITPTIGVATATSINKLAITAPATGSTLAIADGKTFTVSNTITLAGTDSTTITLPTTTGTVALNNQIHYIGTTSVAINRASANLALTGITSIDGSAASATKATNLVGGNATTLLGSIGYQSATDTTTLLGPNTTATKKFLRMTGDGTNGAAPAWDTLVAGDIPSLSSAQLATILSDETGTGVVVFGTSPAITTSITTASTSFDLLNTTATTLNIGGAATTVSIGATTGTASINNATVTLGNATALNVNGASPTLASTSTGTLTLFNTNLLTVNAFNAATTATLVNSATTLGIGNTATAAQTVNMFTASTGASTYNIATGATANATTKAINIGTAGVSGSTTNIAIGSTVSGATSTLTFGGTVADATATSTAKSVGYLGMPQQSKSSAYTTVIGDAGKHIYVTATATITIDSNANVPYPIGTTIAFIAASGATVTIAITSDTMYLGGTGTTGSRTLAAFGMATAVKVTSTSWFINGTGLT